MKKIFSISAIALFMFAMNIMTFAQPDYSEKKKDFWEKYQIYKNALKNNIPSEKPLDPSGLFEIDEDNNFALKNSNPNPPFNNAPWINNERDVVSSGFVFGQSTTTYTPAIGGTVLGTGFQDDGYFSGVAIGFNFVYNGTTYTTISVSDNGWITMGTLTPTGYTPICTGSYANPVAPFARDLEGNTGDTIRYLLTGSAPNRVLTVEWYHWGFFSTGGLNELNFQLKLYETSNIIQYVYQPQTPSTTDASIGVGF